MEVAPVGVKTRARAPLAMGAASSATKTKKRKLNTARELKVSSPTSSSSCIQLRSRRGLTITPETTEERRYSSPSSDHDTATSCCSSNGSSSLLSEEEERSEFVDLQEGNAEVETSTYGCRRERRETTPSSELRAESDDLDSTARPTEANSSCRSAAEKKQKPTQSEIEEFFADAEKDMQKRFMEKYNYDIVNDVPLEGRYEWVRLEP